MALEAGSAARTGIAVHDAPPPSTAAQDGGFARGTAKLSLGVILASRELPAWQQAVLRRAAATEYAELALVVLMPASRAGQRERPGAVTRTLRRVLTRLDLNMVCEEDALVQSDATPLLRDIRTVHVGSDAGAVFEAQLPYAVDVFLDFTHSAGSTAIAEFARFGVWRLIQPYSVSHEAANACFWPVYHRWAVADTLLMQYDAAGRGVELGRTGPAIHPHSLKLSASAVCWRMTSFVLQKLRQLHELGVDALSLAPDQGSPASPVRVRGDPTAAHLASYVGRNLTRRARASAARRLTLDQWILMFHFGDALCTTPSKFTKIVPPKDRFWADPHVMQRGGRFYIFCEELPFATGKGHIVVVPLGADGTWEPAQRVLERGYHLSYPFVFEHDGELYMVPESEANRTIDLYRCVEFPARWEFVTTLIEGVAATDTTLMHREGRWWLFTNLLDTSGASYSEELYIFYSDSLTGSEWKGHARNPVVSDARRARPAGAMIELGGHLLRPAQDCSQRYGYGIRLHEVEALSAREFRETELARIEPTWDSRIVATHTLSYTPGLTVIDALQPRLRF